jgi:hypothetical protein
MLPLQIHPTHSPDPTEDSLEGCFAFRQRATESFEIYWHQSGNGMDTGWYWGWIGRPILHPGPFVTSGDAFDNAQEATSVIDRSVEDRRWAAQVWAKLDQDDETRDHYRAKASQE